MICSSPRPDALHDLEARLGHPFRDRSLLVQALTHSSYANEQAEGTPDNERLEFLGDAVLSFLAADLLYRHGDLGRAEGTMSRNKAFLVSDATLARLAAALDLGRSLRLGVGEERSGGRAKPSVLSGALEAVVGAVYLDGGTRAARKLVRLLLLPLLEDARADADPRDPKTALQEWLQARGRAAPTYRVVQEEGPDHRKRFRVQALLGARPLGEGEGATKKAAAQQAARDALTRLPGRTERPASSSRSGDPD